MLFPPVPARGRAGYFSRPARKMGGKNIPHYKLMNSRYHSPLSLITRRWVAKST